MNQDADSLAPLRDFVIAMIALVERERREALLLESSRRYLSGLIARDDWLPDAFAHAAPGVYWQYLRHRNPMERSSAVSFVWGPDGRTPIHDHTVWGPVGALRGAERCEEYAPAGEQNLIARGRSHVTTPGMIEAVSPTTGDWHIVSKDLPDRDSVSIDVYGGNIGAVRRHLFEPAAGVIKEFVSGYCSPMVPNLWDRPAAAA